MKSWIYAVIVCATSLNDAYSDTSDVTLTADKVTCEQDKNVCTAVGHVKLTQPSKTQPNTTDTLDSDTLTVWFTPKDAPKNSSTKTPGAPHNSASIQKAHAKGQVVIVHGDVTAYADEAEFDTASDTVTLLGHVRIHDAHRGYSESDKATLNRSTGVYTLSRQAGSLNAGSAGTGSEGTGSSGKRVTIRITSPKPTSK